jgi:formamidopyrimidine-DNA glycosylase
MPELPEVETVRQGLESTIVGRTIGAVEVSGKRTVRRQSTTELGGRLSGRTVVAVRRRGKFLALELDDGQFLIIHLRMTGQLLHVPQPSLLPRAPHTHAVMTLDDGSEVRFADQRTFGEWYVTGEAGEDGLPADFSRLGPDPLVDGLPARVLRHRLANRRSPLKAALTDQRVVAGIGNIYADEICFRARVRPDRRCDTLTTEETRRLASSTATILRRAVQLRGSSLRDQTYRDLMGDLGGYQARHQVYARAGEPCSRCGSPVSRIGFGARVAYCCEVCQE